MVETDVLQVVEQPPFRRPEFERGESEQRHQRLDPEAGLSFLDEKRLPQSHRKPSHRGPGRGPLGLAGLRSHTFRRSGPEDRRPDGIPVLGCRPRPGGQPLESNFHSGLPLNAHVDLSRHGRRLEPVFEVDRRRRFRRAAGRVPARRARVSRSLASTPSMEVGDSIAGNTNDRAAGSKKLRSRNTAAKML